MSKGGANKKNNLVASCASCNERKLDKDAVEFLLSNYRNGLLTQDEYLKQKNIIENLILQKQ
jgi:hypothetical protein